MAAKRAAPAKKAAPAKRAAPARATSSPATTDSDAAVLTPPAASEVGGLGQCSVCGARITTDGSCERGHGR